MLALINNQRRDSSARSEYSNINVNINLTKFILHNSSQWRNNAMSDINTKKRKIDTIETIQHKKRKNEKINTDCNNNNNNGINSLFQVHETKVLETLSDFADKVFEENGYNKIYYKYPMEILKCINEFVHNCWTWTTHQKQVTLINDNTIMFVNNNVSMFNTKCVGTASIGIDGINNFSIHQNETYLFEFKYKSKGCPLDAIIGITDKNFKFTSDSLGVGNQINAFNFGLRSDGILCYNNKNVNWNIDNIKTRLNDNDILSLYVSTIGINKSVLIQIWINNTCKYSENLNTFKNIQFPLNIMASAARNGGYQIIRGCKLK